MANNSGNLLIALLTGAIIGTGIGILYAPDEGKKTRKKIKKKALDVKHDITEKLSHAKDELSETIKKKKDDFEHKLEDTITNMSNKADEILLGLEKKLEDLRKKNLELQK